MNKETETKLTQLINELAAKVTLLEAEVRTLSANSKRTGRPIVQHTIEALEREIMKRVKEHWNEFGVPLTLAILSRPLHRSAARFGGITGVVERLEQTQTLYVVRTRLHSTLLFEPLTWNSLSQVDQEFYRNASSQEIRERQNAIHAAENSPELRAFKERIQKKGETQ